MILDTSTLSVGDTLFDIVKRKTATVTQIFDSTFEVSIEGRTALVKRGGIIGGSKRLYWSDPVIFVPAKGDDEKLTKLLQIAEIL